MSIYNDSPMPPHDRHGDEEARDPDPQPPALEGEDVEDSEIDGLLSDLEGIDDYDAIFIFDVPKAPERPPNEEKDIPL
jgi:hypothetical protein